MKMNCKNCNTNLSSDSDYCNKCGGKIIRNRLTIRNLFQHFSETFLNYDNKFLQTVKNLFVKPEDVIGSYVDGTRKKYINPISFFAISLTISGVYLLIFKKFFYNYMDASSLYQDENMRRMFDASKDTIFEYNSFFYFILIPALALISLIVFYNKKYNYTEHVVIYLYTMSLTSIVSSVISLIVLLSVPKYFLWIGISLNLISILFHCYLLKRVFKLKTSELSLKFLLFLVIFGGFYIAFGILMFLFMLMNGSINMQDFRPPS